MTEKLIALRIHALQAIEARMNGDAGQGATEYIGAIVVAAAVVAIVLAAVAGIDVGAAFKSAVAAITSGKKAP